MDENDRQHEEYMKLCQEIKEICKNLTDKFSEYSGCMMRFGEHMSRYGGIK